MKFANIKQFTRSANYSVNISWTYLEYQLNNYAEAGNADEFQMDPEFQRAHVWTQTQQTRYVEFILRGGKTGKDVYWNHPGWNSSYEGTMVLVDGKQRLEAVRKFMRNELMIFDKYRFEHFTDKPRMTKADFIFHINDLSSKEELLQWYIDLNTGGTQHTEQEIQKVKDMIKNT